MSNFDDHSETIAVLGAGSWGSTLARLLASSGKRVKLWTRNKAKAEMLHHSRQLTKPVPVHLPENVLIVSDLTSALEQAEVILFCCTSQAMRVLAENVRGHFMTVAPGHHMRQPILVSAAKGLELNSLKRMSEVLAEILPTLPVSALSGPNLAAEILSDLPTAAVVAAKDITVAAHVQKVLSVPKFRLYSNTDLIGVELGGTLKNVIAIAAGGSDGLKLGSNAKAALLTRGLAEMTRLAIYMGAKPSTLAGLAGMGDLYATCNGPLSRNYRLGMEMARGRSMSDILEEVGAVIEGIPTTEAVCELSKRLGVELPIAETVQDTLQGNLSPEKAIYALLDRPLVSE